ncbi:transposase [Streptomyces sp. NPDC051976]|uniref:transposase n=1 Tax=Streptomyces sp. NPDC051976 TaxID=3154947 RepID=UPI00341CD7B0
MLHLADRGSDGLELMRQAASTGADLLWRVSTGRLLPAVEELDDGSWLSMVSTPTGRNQLVRWVHRDRRRGVPPQVQGVAVRVIEADITVTDRATGTVRTSSLRLVTTLLDPQRYPAQELAALYHERWAVETAYYGLKVTALGSGTVLRSHHPRDVFQELFALFIVLQVARRIAADAATAACIDPDRISLTVTLRTARHTVINADPMPSIELGRTPRISAAILNPRDLGPEQRRSRIIPRRVKRTLSKFAYHKARNDKPLQKVATTITIPPAALDSLPTALTSRHWIQSPGDHLSVQVKRVRSGRAGA